MQAIERYIDTARPREPRSFSEPREKVIARACKMVGVLGSVHVLTYTLARLRESGSLSLSLSLSVLGSPVAPQLHLSPTPHVAFPHCPPFFHRVFVLVEPRARSRDRSPISRLRSPRAPAALPLRRDTRSDFLDEFPTTPAIVRPSADFPFRTGNLGRRISLVRILTEPFFRREF